MAVAASMRFRTALILVVAHAVGAAPAGAQCLDFVTTLKTYNCVGAPPPPEANSKSFESVVIQWHGKSFLFMSTGNEMELYNAVNPPAPTLLGRSGYSPGNLGDSDYDLMSFEVCDDCRFGIANYKMGIVVFDLGTSPAQPSWGARTYFPVASSVVGGMVFAHNGRHYVLANDLSGACGGASLFEVTNSGQVSLQHLGCFTVPGVSQTRVLGGFKVGASHLYVSDQSGAVFIVQIQGSGGATSLSHVGTAPFRAKQQRTKGFDLDRTMGLVVAGGTGTWAGWLELYDFGGLVDPAATVTSPRLVTRMGPPGLAMPYIRTVAIQWPLVYGAYIGSTRAPEIYDIAGVTQGSPDGWIGPLDPGFWDPANSWNNWECRKEYDAAFHPSADALYMARYQVAQVVDTSECAGPTPPIAALTLSPPTVFPGTTTTVADASVGSVQRRAIWVTEGPSPTAAAIAGSTAMATATQGNSTLAFTIPLDPGLTTTYWAHVAVDSASFPCGAAGTSCPALQLASAQIGVDRAPTTTVMTSPALPITGDTVTLTPIAQGAPQPDPGAGSAYEWTLHGPQGPVPVTPTGSGAVSITLSASGSWRHQLRVHYAHAASGGADPDGDGRYEHDTDTVVLEVSSVSASFTVSPSSPLNTQAITLTSTSSSGAGAVLSHDWDVLDSEGAAVVEPLSWCGGAQCVLPGETLEPGSYRFRLRLTNSAVTPSDVSDKVSDPITVADGSLNLSLVANDSTPDIGQTVTFTIDGVPASAVEQASWSFGGASCDSSTYPQSWVCVPGPAWTCGAAAYRYAISGSKTVAVTVVVNGQSHPLSTQVTVSSSGSCGGGTGCAYELTPSSSPPLPETGGEGSFLVATSASTCAWEALGEGSWIHLTGSSSGVGNGTVTYRADPNAGAARTAELSVEGAVHTVVQSSGVGACVAGLIADDGGAEAAVGWGTGAAFLQRVTPAWVPFSVESVCVGLTRTGGDTTLSFDAVVYAADGPAGGPGSLLGRFPSQADGVPPWLTLAYCEAATGPSPVAILEGSFFAGVEWDEAQEQGFYVGVDASSATPPQEMYYRGPTGDWTPLTNAIPGARALMVRVSGSSGVDGGWRLSVGGAFGGGNGFGSAGNLALTAGASHHGRLYMGTGNPVAGGEIWSSGDGTTWAPAALGGVGGGAKNDAVTLLRSFNGALFAGIRNAVLGAPVMTSGDGAVWQPVSTAGFGDPLNVAILSSAGFGEDLFVGTAHVEGGEVWRSTPAGAWSQVNGNGFGSAANQEITALGVYHGTLYAGTHNLGGAEIWRSDDGLSWSLAGVPGLGDSANVRSVGLATFKGALYVGFDNLTTGAQVWRTSDGVTWAPVVTDGFGSSDGTRVGGMAAQPWALHVLVDGGGLVEAWMTEDGVSWAPTSSPGFNGRPNTAGGHLGVFNDAVFAGTVNPAGGEAWHFGSTSFFGDGFESGGTDRWSASVGLP